MNEEKDMPERKCGCGPFGRKRWYLLPLIPIAAILVFGFIVMLLWNGLMPDIFKLGTITYWQAVGILILSKILFVIGGFRKGGGGWGRGRRHWEWKEKWMNMSDEERAKFKEEWKNRGGDCRC